MNLLRVGDQPIPGYKLARKLGQGGFGSVWQAEGPGGVLCALKFLSLGEAVGLKEYKAIRLLRKIVHPHLIPMAAFWLRDGNGNVLGAEDNNRGSSEFQGKNCELIIQLSLGDMSLADRLKECRAGQPPEAIAGLPVEELLRYMNQAANAIDFLNKPIHALGGTVPSALRHGDIKPGNILIAGDGIWVCDFGLAGILGGPDIRTSVGKPMYTPAYAAPEILKYRGPSKSSDQYSLAVSYIELRTGRFPYDATTKDAVEALIVLGDVYLDFMSGPEQKVLSRALAMNPEDRFPTCAVFVEELKKAIGEQSGRMGRPPTAEDLFCRDSTVVPGFKLEKCLGRGGYGEVWQASGNRMKVALKIVKDLDDKKSKQEWRALETIKEELDHAHLMKLQGYWLLDAWGTVISEEDQNRPGGPKPVYLVIYTDLAEKNLLERLKECQHHGEPGIPVKELLDYMRQSADALDYLNLERHSFGDREGVIIHRDIKPANILLTKKSKVKISDFGLAKMMAGTFDAVSRNSEGLTEIYGAPELHKNKLSRWTDQYSLAVTYYHLRTGRLPMDTSLTPYEKMTRAVLGELDLSGLAEPERAVIARATMVTPEQRYDSCGEMVNALFASVGAVLPEFSSNPQMDVRPGGTDGPTSSPTTSSKPSSGSSGPVYQPVATPPSDSGYRKELATGPLVAEIPQHVVDREKREDLGVFDTTGPKSHDEFRDTPGPGNVQARVPPVHQPSIKSSGDIAIPKEVRKIAQPAPPPIQSLIDDFDDQPMAPPPPKPNWRGDTGPKAATRRTPMPEPDDWRRKTTEPSRPPIAGIVAGAVVALGLIVGIWWWVTSGPQPTVVPTPSQVAQMEELLKKAAPTKEDGDKALTLLVEIEKQHHDYFAKLDKEHKEWKKLIPPPPPPPPALTKEQVAELIQQLENDVTTISRGDADSGKLAKQKIDKIRKSWPIGKLEPTDESKLESLQALILAKAEQNPAELLKLLKQTNKLPEYPDKLIDELDPDLSISSDKAEDRKQGLSNLWNHHVGKLSADGKKKVQKWHYAEFVKSINGLIEQGPPELKSLDWWSDLATICTTAEAVRLDQVVGEASLRAMDIVIAAQAEAALESNKLDNEENKKLFRKKLPASLGPYAQYVDALLDESVTSGANSMLKAFSGNAPSNKGPLRLQARRNRAGTLFQRAAEEQWGKDHLPFQPLDLSAKEDIAKWLNKAVAIQATQGLTPRLQAIRAMTTDDVPTQREASAKYPDNEEALNALGNDRFLFLKAKAKSHENENSADKLTAMKTYRRLVQAVRDYNQGDFSGGKTRIDVKSACQDTIDPATKFGEAILKSGHGFLAEQEKEFRSGLIRLFAEKGRLIADNIYFLGDRDKAIESAKDAFSKAIEYDRESKTSAIFIVERTLLEERDLARDSKFDEIKRAVEATELDKEHYLRMMLEGVYQYRLAEAAEEKDESKVAMDHYRNAAKMFELAYTGLPKPITPETKAHKDIIVARLVGSSNYIVQVTYDSVDLQLHADKVRKYIEELSPINQIHDAEGLVAISNVMEDQAWPRGDITKYAIAEEGFKRALELTNRKAEYLVNLGRLYVKWVAYGNDVNKTKMADKKKMDDAADCLAEALGKELKVRDRRAALLFSGNVKRFRGDYAGALKQYEMACELDKAKPDLSRNTVPWSERLDTLIETAESKSSKKTGAQVADELRATFAQFKESNHLGLKRLAQSADGYAMLLSGGRVALTTVNETLNLPPTFPADLGNLSTAAKPEDRRKMLRRALTWLELFYSDKIDEKLDADKARLHRKLIDSLVETAALNIQDNLVLEARTCFHAALAYHRLATLEAGALPNDRAQAFKLMDRAMARLNPETSALRVWIVQFAKQLHTNATVNSKRPVSERREDLESASKFIKMAIDSAQGAKAMVEVPSLQSLLTTIKDDLRDAK